MKTAKPVVVGTKKTALEIKGMTCEMGCGGSIRKALKETGGVERVQYDFVEGRKKQIALITYDAAKIDAQKMIQLIQTINEKQFTAKLLKDESINN